MQQRKQPYIPITLHYERPGESFQDYANLRSTKVFVRNGMIQRDLGSLVNSERGVREYDPWFTRLRRTPAYQTNLRLRAGFGYVVFPPPPYIRRLEELTEGTVLCGRTFRKARKEMRK